VVYLPSSSPGLLRRSLPGRGGALRRVPGTLGDAFQRAIRGHGDYPGRTRSPHHQWGFAAWLRGLWGHRWAEANDRPHTFPQRDDPHLHPRRWFTL